MKSISKLLYYLTSLTILCILAACDTTTPVTVNTAADPTAVFGKYHTYAIDTASIGLSATGSAALQSALRSSLAAKGLKETGSGSDLYIVPTVYTREKLNVMPGGGYTVYPSAYGGYRTGTVALNAGVQTYNEGTLIDRFCRSQNAHDRFSRFWPGGRREHRKKRQRDYGSREQNRRQLPVIITRSCREKKLEYAA